MIASAGGRLLRNAGLLAVGCAASAAAFSQSSQVSIYGVMDAGFVHESGGAQGSVTKLEGGISGGSRIGFTGSEDLGGGNSAIFTLESGILAETGNFAQGGTAFGRQSFVGLNSSTWGAVTLGRQYTPAALVQVEMDPFSTGLAGTSANLLSPGGVGGNNRMNGTIKYTSPQFGGGFVTELAYAMGGVPGNASANSQYGGMFGYVAGPWAVKLAIHETRDASNNSGKVTWLAGRYALGDTTLYANYVINKGDSVAGITNTDSHDVLIGATYTHGSDKYIASYIKKFDQSAAGDSPRQLAVGYIHSLSKRTSLYTSYAVIGETVPNTSAGFYTVGNATFLGTGASGNHAFNVGMRHNF